MKKLIERLLTWLATRKALAGKPLSYREKQLLMKRYGLKDDDFTRRPRSATL